MQQISKKMAHQKRHNVLHPSVAHKGVSQVSAHNNVQAFALPEPRAMLRALPGMVPDATPTQPVLGPFEKL